MIDRPDFSRRTDPPVPFFLTTRFLSIVFPACGMPPGKRAYEDVLARLSRQCVPERSRHGKAG